MLDTIILAPTLNASNGGIPKPSKKEGKINALQLAIRYFISPSVMYPKKLTLGKSSSL